MHVNEARWTERVREWRLARIELYRNISDPTNSESNARQQSFQWRNKVKRNEKLYIV